jgi:hypothetical protein
VLYYHGRQRVVDADGSPVSRALANFYVSGTSTRQDTYQNSDLTIRHANPVQADDYGFLPPIYLDPSLNYKSVITDALGVSLPDGTVDPVIQASSDQERTTVEISLGITPTNNSYPPGHVYRYGTNTTPGTTDMSTALSRANAVALASGLSIIIPETLHIVSSTTVTAPILDTMAQIFSTTSAITISNKQPVRPEWWGSGQDTIRFAVNALPSTGGVVQLESTTYQKNNFSYGTGAASGVAITKSNVTLRGRKRPQLASDCKSLTNGTIIQGWMLVFADNFEASDLGFDNGFTVNGGVSPASAADGLLLTYPDDTTKAANGLRRGAKLNHIIGLCYGPNVTAHGVIVGEGYTDVVCTGEIAGCYGLHGIVIKCSQVKAEQLTGYLNGTDGIIIKSDLATTAVSNSVQIDRIVSYAGGPSGWSPYATPTTTTGTSNFGILLHAYATSVSKIQIGEVLENGHTIGLKTQFDGAFVLDSLKIGCIVTDANADAGVWLTASTAAGASMQRVQIGKIETRNTQTGVIFDWVTSSFAEVNAIHAVNCTNAALSTTSSASPVIDVLVAENCGAAFQITSTSKPLIGKTLLTGTTTVYYQTSGTGQSPSLSNSWAQVGGGDTFNVILKGYGVAFNGLISGGSTNVLMTLPQFARPTTEKRLMLQGRGGGGQGAVPVVVATSGVVTINDAAGGTANVTLYLSLAGLEYSLSN